MITWMIKRRIIIILILICCTVPFAITIPKIKRDAGISALVPESHSAYEFFDEMEDLFGATDQIVIGVYASTGVFTRDTLKLIQELTDFYRDRDDIEEDDIVSLTMVDDMTGRDGELVISPLLDEDDLEDLTPEILERTRERAMSNPMFRGKLVSLDEKSAVILVGVQQDVTMNEDSISRLKNESVQKLNELRQKYPGVSLDFSGPAMMKAYISEYMLKDLKTLFPLAILTVAVVILLIVRSVVGMIIPIIVTLFAVIWTFGLKAIIGSPITIVETAIPVALIAIGCADGIHIVSDFMSHRRSGDSPKDAVKKTMRVLTLPVVLTSLTTSAGFVSLLTAPGVSIRNMGVFLACGVMVAMVFSVAFVPMVLSFLRGKSKRALVTRASYKVEAMRFESKMVGISTKLIQYRVIVAFVGLIVLGLSVIGIMNINIESDEIRYLKKNNDFRKATENISEHLGGITSLDIIIEGEDPDFFKQPATLKAIEKLQRYVETDELVSYSLSISDLIKRLNFILHDGQSAYDRLPNDIELVPRVDGPGTEEIPGASQVAQYLFLYEISGGESTSQFVDDAYQIGKVSVRLKDMSSQKLDDLIEKITQFSSSNFPSGTTVKYTNHYIRVVMMNLIIESQIYSLITVLVTILVFMSIIFKSPVIGVFTSLPVIIAVLFNFTIMWLFGVTLNIGTSIIASVGMGVGIDYAIHYYTRFRLVIRSGEAYFDAIIKAVALTSRAILTNATAVGLGFLVLLFSEYGVIAAVGWIVAVTMFTTAAGSLVVLPALLAIFKPKIR